MDYLKQFNSLANELEKDGKIKPEKKPTISITTNYTKEMIQRYEKWLTYQLEHEDYTNWKRETYLLCMRWSTNSSVSDKMKILSRYLCIGYMYYIAKFKPDDMLKKYKERTLLEIKILEDNI